MQERRQRDRLQPGTTTAIPQLAALFLFALLAFAGLALLGLRGGSTAEPLKPLLLATGEWAPYSGEGLPEKGVAAAVLSAVFQQMGYQPQFRFLPWARTEQVAYEDESDKGIRGAFPYVKTPEREARFYFSAPLSKIRVGLFFAKEAYPEAAGIRSEAELANYEVIPVSGYRYPPAVEKRLAQIPPVADNMAAFRLMLQSPKRLLVAEATQVTEDLLRSSLAAEAQRIGMTGLFFDNPIHYIASQRNPENGKLMREFDSTLKRMQDDGSLDAILASTQAAIDAKRMVRLQALGPRGEIEAFTEEKGSRSLLLPQGTQALVERWSENFLQPHTANKRKSGRILIRVLNGPLRGQRFYVDERSILLP